MLLHLGGLLLKGYRLLLTVAAGGFVGANISGLMFGMMQFASNAQRAPDLVMLRWWTHGGWVVGAGLFLVGEIARILHSSKGKVKVRRRSRNKQTRSLPSGFSSTIGSRPCGILGSFGVGSLIGGFLGLMLGGSFLLLWFSLTYSPFAPSGWASSISAETIGPNPSDPKSMALTTNHPVALYVFSVPIVLGATAGGLLCSVGTTIEKLKNGK